MSVFNTDHKHNGSIQLFGVSLELGINIQNIEYRSKCMSQTCTDVSAHKHKHLMLFVGSLRPNI
jgi:hypothetical protein